jgi:hypothetical protein
MFEGTVGSQLITQIKIREGKIRQNMHSRDGLKH